MEPLRRKDAEGSGGPLPPERSQAYPDDPIRASYKLIATACICAGLSPADSEDLAQDMWEWLIRTGVPMAVIATPWLRGAVHNYILRYRRRSYSQKTREGRPLETAPEPQVCPPLPALEKNELLDQVAAHLPRRERDLLALIRLGHPLAEAARLLGIPRGSCADHQGRLIAYARREMQRRGSAARKDS